MSIELTYAEVEAVLAALHHIADDKRVAFKARLKHFQRLKFPDGSNTGTGKRVVYTIDMFVKLAFAMELTQIGMSPKRIVHILRLNWELCAGSIPLAITPRAHFDKWQPPITHNNYVWMLSPESLRDLAEGGEDDLDYYGLLTVIPMADLENNLLVGDVAVEGWERDMGADYRQTIIVLRPFLFSLVGLLMEVRPDISIVDIWRDTYETLSDSVRNGLDRRLVIGGENGNNS